MGRALGQDIIDRDLMFQNVIGVRERENIKKKLPTFFVSFAYIFYEGNLSYNF